MVFASVSIHVLAKQVDLFDTLVCQVSDLGNDVIDRPRDLFTASVGNHAKGAVLAAAFHDGDEGCRAVTGRLW